jgi:mono/diheme cytochrome c family protein
MPRYSSYSSVQAPDIFGSYLQGQQARQQNTLAQMDLDRRQRVNALAGNPNASAEDYVRAGDVQTGNALLGVQRQKTEMDAETAKRHYLANQAVENAADPIAAARELLPDSIAQFEQAHGPGSFSQLAPDQVKAIAKFAKEKAAAQAGVDLQPSPTELSRQAFQTKMDEQNFGQQKDLAGLQHKYRLDEIGVQNASKPGRSIRAMTPDEIAKAGLPPGTAAQVDETTGKIDVMTKRDTTGVLSQKDATAAKIKLKNVQTARQQLERIKEAFAEGTGGAGMNAFGPMQGFPTQLGKKFDARVDQMRSTLTALTRTPGVGSMSDYETKLDQSKFPARGDYESVTADKIKGLEDLLASIESGYTDLLSGGAQAGAASAPTAATPAPASVPTATGPNGQKLYLRNGQWVPQ